MAGGDAIFKDMIQRIHHFAWAAIVFGLAKMTPLIEYWHHLLIVAFVFMLNIPLKYVTHVLFEKLRQRNDKKEKSE